MKIVFNDSFAADPSLFKTQTKESSVFVSGNLIFENKTVTSANDSYINSIVNLYNNASSDIDKLAITGEVQSGTGRASGWTEANKTKFFNSIGSKQSTTENKTESKAKSKFESVIDTIRNDAEKINEPFEDVSTLLEDRSIIIDRLKGYGLSDQNLGEIFDFIFKAGIPQSEILSFIDEILKIAVQAGTSVDTIILFALEHYTTRRSKGVTVDLVKGGAQLQEKYPELNVFDMLRKSAQGRNPEIGKLAIIDDRADMELARMIFSLSQHRNVEQNEAVRRERQSVRDALQSMQERTNLQRALVSALDSNQVERALTKEIEKYGELYKTLITSPVFRALKQYQYVINAGRRLVDTWMTTYLDTQPMTARLSPQESRAHPQSISDMTGRAQNQNQSSMPSRRDRTFFSSSNGTRFLKIAQEQDNSQYILEVAQGFVSQLDQFRPVLIKQINDGIDKFLSTNSSSIQNKIGRALGASELQNTQQSIVGSISKYFETLRDSISSQMQDPATLSFQKAHNDALKQLFGNPSTRPASAYYRQVIAQGTPQTSRPAVVDKNKLISGSINGLLNIVKTVLSADALVQFFQTGDLGGNLGLVKLFQNFDVLSKSFYQQFDLQVGGRGRLAPQDQSIFDQGKLTSEGANLIQNAAEVDSVLTVLGQVGQEIFKIKSLVDRNKKALQEFEVKIKSQLEQTVDTGLGEASNLSAPMEFPPKVKQNYELFVQKLEDHVKLLRTLVAEYKKLQSVGEFETLDANQKRTLVNNMTAYENELTSYLKKVNDYKTTNIIREEIEFQKRLRYILEGMQEQFEPFIEGGINLFGVISQPNGFAQVFKAARGNLDVQLDKLLDKEAELLQKNAPLNLNIPEVKTDSQATSGQVNLGQPGKVTQEMVK